ncbi:MAG: helix-turn-helix domain-containing protein [Lentisphaerae bacterium]|nr:helix-turn-helix domain-containing protein [Lentisphaerota bacterium]
MTIGSQLRKAREDRKLSPSDVAAATRSKIQFIEAIERDDYSVFAAPIYGKGFIRLYAQCVGLDPQPLLDAYAKAASGRKQPSLVSEGGPPVPAANPPPRADAPAAPPDEEAPRRRTQEFDLFNATEPRTPPAAPPPAAAAPPPPREERSAAARALLREVVIRWWLALRENWNLSKTRAADMHPEKDPWKVVPIVIGIVLVLIFVVSGLSRCAHRRDAAARPLHGAGGELRLAAEAPEPYFD